MLECQLDTCGNQYGCIPGLANFFLLTADLALKKLELQLLPTFIPNEYLFTEYAKTIPDYERLERWEIYAHAVRDLITTHGGFAKDDGQSVLEKFSLNDFCFGVKDEITVNGKTWTWPFKQAKSVDTEINSK